MHPKLRLPWGIEPRHVLAAVLGGALIVMPLLILSYDPNSKLERLRQPLCQGGLIVEATNQQGGPTLLMPQSGIKVSAHAGAPVGVRLTLFTKDPGLDWKVNWQLEAPSGHETFVLDGVKAGTLAYVRAIDGTGNYCPADSPTLTASVS